MSLTLTSILVCNQRMYFVDLMFGRSKFMIAAIIVLISVTALIVGVYFLGKYGKERFA